MIEKINYYLDKFFGLETIRVMPREAIKYAKKYFKNKKIIVVEIGVFRGKNSKNILKSFNISKIYLVDPYINYVDCESNLNDMNIKIAEEEAKKRLGKFSNKIVWVKEFSENAMKKIPSNIDFIYVDGNHEYEYVKKDLELYWKKLKKGGVLSGHDIQCLGVSKAVLEFAEKNKLDVHFGDRRDWWILK